MQVLSCSLSLSCPAPGACAGRLAWWPVVLVCTLLTIPIFGAPAEDAQFENTTLLTDALSKFDEAAALPRARQAQARRLYRQAADEFEALIANGIHNGPLYYNLGNTYLRLGELGRAILAYRRAEQYMPHDARLAANLRFVRAQRVNQIEQPARSRLMESLFFWHYGTALKSRLITGLVVFCLGWAALIVHLFAARRLLVAAFVGATVLSLALGVSVGTQYYRQRTVPDGVVLAGDVVVRKGNGYSYAPQFEQTLQPGAEFTCVEERGEWMRIRLPDGQEGWIPADTTETL